MSNAAQPATRWTGQTLEPMRQVGDPPADAVIADLFAAGDIAPVNSLMKDLVTNEYPVPESLPPSVRDYLAQTNELPEWADPKLIEAGENVFWRFGPKLILILHCYALPFCYLGRNGVQALALTTRLVSNPTRRILETAQMLVDVMQAGGLTSREGRGRRTIQKVRLMHAAIRRLAPTSPSWKPEFGLPVNQEDLAGTLMSFCWVSLDGLDKLDVKVSESDQEAYLHCWRVVGHLLGIRPELLPINSAEAKDLTAAIARHEFGPTPEGKELTRALVEMLAYLLPGNIFDGVPPLMIRYFLGKEWAAWLGIEESAFVRLLQAPLKLLNMQVSDVLQSSKAVSALAERVGQLLIESIVYVERGGNRPTFSIPADLRQQWGMNWVS